MMVRNARAMVLLVGLAGCSQGGLGVDIAAFCLQDHPGDLGCCLPGDHIDPVDPLACCPAGSHAVQDVEHPQWAVCKFDKAPHACLDAGTDAQ